MTNLVAKTLYGVDTKGGAKVWQIFVAEGAEGFLIRHGKYGGKLTDKFTKVSPKNIGKVNETTPTQQAVLEAESRIKKQIDKGYTEKLGEITEAKNPMLAHDYRKQGHRVDYSDSHGVFVQPKLDGVRCLVFLEDDEIVFLSRGGKKYPVPPHLGECLRYYFDTNKDLILDGELYIHGMHLQDIVSYVKKPKEGSEDLTYEIFDIVSDKKYLERMRDLKKLFGYSVTSVHLVPTFKVFSEDDVKTYHDTFAKEGYEGVMIRTGKGLYKYNHRSADLQKYKEFFDEEFEIVDVEEDNEGFGVPVCKTEDGKLFKATFKATHEERAKLLKYKEFVIGSPATIKYQSKTKDGIPTFTICLAIRNYE